VLIAGPGGGKSTLLRTRLRDTADEWLRAADRPRKPIPGVPVWVSARSLAGEETQVPDALAAATRKLSRYGRHPGLEAAHFLERPCTGAHWQLLVDDLDELPNAAQRRAVLEKLANAVAGDPLLYRCVVATRPVNDAELDVLDRGGRPPSYELQPFSPDDLRDYTRRYFGTRWPLEEAARRAELFTDALRGAGLDELAETPLMAFLLCQLYLAQPEGPLPGGRSAVYQAFADLIYENNHGKQVADSHEQAIEHLVDRLQSSQARRAALAAAQAVYDRLPELIDYLAHQWLTGGRLPAAATLATHDAVRRPGRVLPDLWDAFLEDLLRHTGLLVHEVDGLGFLHQTFLEYHAACHATRDEQARRRTLDQLFDSRATAPGWQQHQPSYLGFLLDRLLSPQGDRIDEETEARLTDVLSSASAHRVGRFLVQQVRLRTVLPAESTAGELLRFAEHPELGFAPAAAAEALAAVDGFRDRGLQLLQSFANDPALPAYQRTEAAGAAARLDGDSAVPILEALATDPALPDYERISMAGRLVRVDEGCGTALLEKLVGTPDLRPETRLEAGGALARIDRDRSLLALEALANDPIVPARTRIEVAETLAAEDGFRARAAQVLERLALDAAFLPTTRVRAAQTLAAVAADSSVPILEALAADPTIRHSRRVEAAGTLAVVDRARGVRALEDLADDPSVPGYDRAGAIRLLIGTPGHRDRGIRRLESLATAPQLPAADRVEAAKTLAALDGDRDRAAPLLEVFAANPAVPAYDRVATARLLSGLDGFRDRGAQALTTLATSLNLPSFDRVWAARLLTRTDGYRDHGTQLLDGLSTDETLSPSYRTWASTLLADPDG
jgi:uncharacterized protein (UPF0147 family)